MAERSLLLIEDDKGLSHRIAKLLRPFGAVHIVATAADARRALSAQSWSALFVDVGLPDGSGLDVLAYARAANNDVPALVVTGWGDSKTANRAFELGAAFLRKPFEAAQLVAFLEGLADSARTSIGAALPPSLALLERTADAWRVRYGLTHTEHAILRAALVEGESHLQIEARLGIAQNTMKVHVRNLLAKTGDPDLSAAVQRALREAMSLGLSRG
jgi:DNA-binding NarL/FixJ family response regulator